VACYAVSSFLSECSEVHICDLHKENGNWLIIRGSLSFLASIMPLAPHLL
jgi:hypothetical protein